MFTNREQILLKAWRLRREQFRNWEPVDNSTLQAGEPMWFKCRQCFGPIILAENYLTQPTMCYDCRELVDRGLL